MPCRLVRHPGYTGSLLTWTGFALTSRSVPVLVLVAGLLRRDLPGYAAYSERTTGLIPFVW